MCVFLCLSLLHTQPDPPTHASTKSRGGEDRATTQSSNVPLVELLLSTVQSRPGSSCSVVGWASLNAKPEQSYWHFLTSQPESSLPTTQGSTILCSYDFTVVIHHTVPQDLCSTSSKCLLEFHPTFWRSPTWAVLGPFSFLREVLGVSKSYPLVLCTSQTVQLWQPSLVVFPSSRPCTNALQSTEQHEPQNYNSPKQLRVREKKTLARSESSTAASFLYLKPVFRAKLVSSCKSPLSRVWGVYESCMFQGFPTFILL